MVCYYLFCLKLIFMIWFQFREKSIRLRVRLILDLLPIGSMIISKLVNFSAVHFFISEMAQMSLNPTICKLPSNCNIVWFSSLLSLHGKKYLCSTSPSPVYSWWDLQSFKSFLMVWHLCFCFVPPYFKFETITDSFTDSWAEGRLIKEKCK